MRVIFVIFCLVWVSCKKEANIELPATQTKPVIYSYLNPSDTIIKLKLLQSSPLFESNKVNVQEVVKDAEVEIFGKSSVSKLIFNDITQYYELKTSYFPIEYGELYKIKVTTKTGEIATAETRVPKSLVSINSIVHKQVFNGNEYYDHLTISFNDLVDQENYYSIRGSYSFVYKLQSDTVFDDTKLAYLRSDKGIEGGSISYVWKSESRFEQTGLYSIKFYDIYLINCNEEYYKFHYSLSKYSGDDPFSEPGIIYSNINGGHGCFGAFVSSKYRIKVL